MLPTKGKLRNLGMPINGDCPFYLKAKQNLDLKKECDLTTNVWYTIDNNCKKHINTNLGIVDWLEYLCLNKSWYRKNFEDVLEKVVPIPWVIWTYRNIVVLKRTKSYFCTLAR